MVPAESAEAIKTVVLGLGNELLGDEGVGVHAIRRLMVENLPGIQCVEVGTAILDALPVLKLAGRLIILDAMKNGQVPGTVYRVPFAECSGASCIASMHGFDIFRAMALAGRPEPPPVIIFGVEPQELGWSLELSPAVAESLPYLLQAVLEELSEVSEEAHPKFHRHPQGRV